MTYRILYAPDGEHWINNKVNNRKNPAQAVMEANAFLAFDPFAKVKVINPATNQIIYERAGKKT